MSVSADERAEAERARALLQPALEHLIRLEAYFRLNGLSTLAEKTETVLQEAETMMVRVARQRPEQKGGTGCQEGVEEERPPYAPRAKTYAAS
jgi:hypothetical protein